MTVLNEYEGEILREICGVVAQVVDGIFYGTIGPTTRYLIEMVDSEDIMDCLKGSPRLPKLFSQVPASLLSVVEDL